MLTKNLKEIIKSFLMPFNTWLNKNTNIRNNCWSKLSSEKIQEYWNSINDERDNYILNIFQNIEFDTLLEIGSNCGNRLYNLAKLNKNAKITGIDINKEAIEKGNELFKQANINNVNLELKKAEELIDFGDNTFDVVFTSAILIYIKPQDIINVLKNIVRIAKKHIILLEMHQEDIKNDPEGTGILCWPCNWKRDYISLFEKVGIPRNNITTQSIPKHIWNPKGGGATYIKIDK